MSLRKNIWWQPHKQPSDDMAGPHELANSVNDWTCRVGETPSDGWRRPLPRGLVSAARPIGLLGWLSGWLAGRLTHLVAGGR